VIYLVRHGESDWNADGIRHGREDRPLTANGAAQAWAAARRVLPHVVEPVILTSPLRRAHDTARIIAIAAGTDKPMVVPYRDLVERPFYNGRWLETCEEAAMRVSRLLSQFTSTHAGVIKGLLGISTPANGSVHAWIP
jgi:phosphohistidine phosphatase SixA